MIRTKHFISMLLTAGLFISSLSASSFFSGYAGGKLNYDANPEAEDYDPDLKLQAFLAGQFNFAQNIWGHLEFSIDTGDFLNESLFHETESLFQIDELSLTFRSHLLSADNYFSTYMGTYDPIGSDIFLQRYFNIQPIASKMTEGYLGLAGSILYPHFGLGIADIIRFYNVPAAAGAYIYVNHEDEKYYVLNTDLRGACSFRYFTADFAGGFGFPLSNSYQGEDVIVAVDKVYWHAGTTILFGNAYTTSLFIQAGIYNAAFAAEEKSSFVSPSDIYLLFEPRLVTETTHLNLTIFSLPPETVKKLLFVDDTLGVDMHMYTEKLMIGESLCTLGAHLSFGIIDKNFLDFKNANSILENGYNINITPYFSTQFLSGELHIQSNIKIMEFVKNNIGKGISFDVGYRTKF